MTWDGVNRRVSENKSQDHDTLIEMVQILRNHVDNFDKHVEDDKTSFRVIRDQVGKHAVYIYIGLGVIGTLQFLFKN